LHSLDIVRVIKQRRVGCLGLIPFIEEAINVYKFLVGNPRRTNDLVDLGAGGRMLYCMCSRNKHSSSSVIAIDHCHN
jgi:hypothetical protein